MKKIVCLIGHLGSGGAERQLCYLASFLKKNEYQVELWTYLPNDFYKYILDEAGVSYRCISEAESKYKRFFVIKKELQKANPDVVISYLDTPSIVACICKLLGGQFKLIVSDRNTTQKMTIRTRIQFFLFRFADWIVPNSHSQARFIKTKYSYLSNKVRCITNYIDTEKFQPIENKISSMPLKILTVARVMPQKNFIQYMKAIRLVVDRGYSDFKIEWVGQSLGDDYFNRCMSVVKELQLDNYVTYSPQNQNIIEKYQSADIFCLPSLYEGFPNVICEAMSCGLPILCSNVCDNPNIVTVENGILFSPTDVNDIADAIIRMLSINDYSQYAKRNRLRAKEIFSQQNFIDAYLNII